MTTRISSYSESQALPDPIGSPSASPAATSPHVLSSTPSSGSQAGGAASSGEAVTLTQDAQTSTELLEAARAADGTDPQAIQSLKAKIESGTYQLPPETLAASIVAVLKETRS